MNYQTESIETLENFLNTKSTEFFSQEEVDKLYKYNTEPLNISFSGKIKDIKKTSWHNNYDIFSNNYISNKHLIKLRKALIGKYKKYGWELQAEKIKDNRTHNYKYFIKDVVNYYIDFFGKNTLKKIIKKIGAKNIFKRLKTNVFESCLKSNKIIGISKLDLFSKMDILDIGKNNRVFLTLPTGAGKTTIISELMKKLQSVENNKKINFIVYKDDLLLQSVLSFNNAGIFPAINKSKVKEIKKYGGIIDLTSNIFIGNIQGKTPEADIIIIDEAHRTGADGYEKYLIKNINKLIIGMSATPYRNDGKTMSSYYKREINPYTLAEHLKNPNTPRFIYNLCKQNININARFSDGDTEDFKMITTYSDEDLNKILWLFEKTKGQSNLIFTDKVDNAVIIDRYLKVKGFKSAFIVGNNEIMKDNDCFYNGDTLEIIKQFKDGKINFLVSVNKLLYGTDCPNTDNLIILRPTRSINLFTQMLGRGLRLGATQDVNIYDCCNLMEIQDNLEHFDIFFKDGGYTYNFYNSIEKIGRWESIKLRDLATRDYTTEREKGNNDYVINNYIKEEKDKYFIIKYKKGNFTKYINFLKNVDLSIKSRKIKIFNYFFYNDKDGARFLNHCKNYYGYNIVKVHKDLSGENNNYISYSKNNEIEENVVDYFAREFRNLNILKNELLRYKKNKIDFYNEKMNKLKLVQVALNIKPKHHYCDLFDFYGVELPA